TSFSRDWSSDVCSSDLPSQFQKQLRLQEARRLLLGEDLDAASAAYRVGYHDASHFNREYKSLFGVPPMRDVQRLRDEALQSAGQIGRASCREGVWVWGV